jgi:hypothetical protein
MRESVATGATKDFAHHRARPVTPRGEASTLIYLRRVVAGSGSGSARKALAGGRIGRFRPLAPNA